MKALAVAGYVCGAAMLMLATATDLLAQQRRAELRNPEPGELATLDPGAAGSSAARANQFTVDAIERWAVELKLVLDASLCAMLTGASLIATLLVSLASNSNPTRRIVFRKDEELSKPVNWRPLAVRALAISTMAFGVALTECIVIDPLMSYRYVDLELGGYGGLYFGLFFCIVSFAIGLGGLLYTVSLILRHDVEPPEAGR